MEQEAAARGESFAPRINPRSAALYDAAAATWRDVALGRVTVRQNNPAMYRVDLDVVEGA